MRTPGTGRSSAAPCDVLRWTIAAGSILATFVGGITATEDAVANGDTRTISFYHQHRQDSATITFRRDGRYDPQALEQLNWFLRDWRTDEKTRMDPRLFDTAWELYRSLGANEPIHVISAYRSPQTNAMLRARSRRVSESSQHMSGKAIDLHIPDVPVDKVRAVAMKLQHGGVGYYAGAFVHVDVGSVRAWPRMSRDQLVRLFPDGKTVHLPADGKPLPGYDQARAELLARGDTVHGYNQVASAEEGGSGKSLFAMLFGSRGDEDREEAMLARAPGRTVAGARGALAFAPETTAAVAPGKLASRSSPEAAKPGLEDDGSLDPPTRLALAPLPPPRPQEFAAYAALAAPPPPLRPVGLLASADPDALPLSFRAADEPAGPPASAASPKAADPAAGAPDRGPVRALFARAATSARAALSRVKVASVRAKPHDELPAGALAPADATAALRFSSKWTAGPSPARFAGPAIATMASLR